MDIQPNQSNPNIPKQDPVTPPTPIVYESEEYHWEYKYIQQDLHKDEVLEEANLNELGKKGWELIAVFTHNQTAHYYFKRPAEEN